MGESTQDGDCEGTDRPLPGQAAAMGKPLRMSDFVGKRVLLIVSGGIAAYKALELIRLLRGRAAASPAC